MTALGGAASNGAQQGQPCGGNTTCAAGLTCMWASGLPFDQGIGN